MEGATGKVLWDELAPMWDEPGAHNEEPRSMAGLCSQAHDSLDVNWK